MAYYKPAPRIFPLQPLLDTTRLCARIIATHAHINGTRMREITSEGMTVAEADRAAVAVGLHPADVWGDLWWDPELQAEAANRWQVTHLAASLDIGLAAAHVMFAAQLATSEVVKGSLARPAPFFDRTGRQGITAGRTHTTGRSAAA